ncbi:MAG: hypothetical protein N2C12_00930, partial [Planctomycetales bacterium]
MLRGRTAGFCRARMMGWIALLMLPSSAAAQTYPPLLEPPASESAFGGISEQYIADVQIVGNRQVNLQEIRAEMDSRPGQVLDTLKIQRDKRSLLKTRKFYDIDIKTQPTNRPGWVVVIFEVQEFPKLEYVYLLG